MFDHLVPVAGTVIFGTDHQTATFPRAAEDSLQNIDELLFILKNPVQLHKDVSDGYHEMDEQCWSQSHLVIVTSAKVDHHVLIAEEEHDSAGIVQLIHDVEIGHLRFALASSYITCRTK